MASQLLIYENAVPINKNRHAGYSIKAGKDYSFAKTANSVPLTTVEFSRAASEFPIIFAGKENEIMPVAVLGLRENENLFVDDQGNWSGSYIPTFLRRYPFVFSSTDEGKTLTLCIDESFKGCNQDGKGERLFDSDGEQTQYLKAVLTFLQGYQAHFGITQAFCKKLNEMDLLEQMGAQYTNADGQQESLTGFMAVNRNKLKALPDEKLLAMMKSDELEILYLHLQSMNNFSKFAPLMSAAKTDEEKESPVEETVEAFIVEDEATRLN